MKIIKSTSNSYLPIKNESPIHPPITISKYRTLLAGPWCGEMGWELFGWQGYLRSLSSRFGNTVIGCREGMEYLYCDFADTIILYDIGPPGTGGWQCDDLNKVPDIRDEDDEENYTYIHPSFKIGYSLHQPADSNPAFFRQKFIKFGIEADRTLYDIIIHARNTDKNHSHERNIWSREDWKGFVEEFKDYRIACIGTRTSALSLDGTTDLRDKDLNLLCNTIRNSICVVGPSSGPMHLSALCGTPQVVFTADPNNKARYKEYWNPFDIEVEYIPMVDYNDNIKTKTYKSTRRLLNNG